MTDDFALPTPKRPTTPWRWSSSAFGASSHGSHLDGDDVLRDGGDTTTHE